MKRTDIQKTADELLSDSCFSVLEACNQRIAKAEAELAALREAAKGLIWGTDAELSNYLNQQYTCGELLGLSYMQGALEAHVRIKTDLAAVARRHEASSEAA